MNRPKVKSAPPRLRSKFVKNRTNAMKEIEAWVRKDNESYAVPEASRMSGQLSDNVTEERMLKAKLWELSKERYKFLSQNTYEKKVFQDRQQKKTSLRRVVSASADGRQRHSSEESRAGRRNSFGDAAPKPRIRNARLALLDRLDPTKGKRSAMKKAPTDETIDSAKPSGRAPLSRGASSASFGHKNEPNEASSKVAVGGNGAKKPTQTSQISKIVSDQQDDSMTTPTRSSPLRTKSVPAFPRRPMFPDSTPTSREDAASKIQSNSSIVINQTPNDSATASPKQTQTGIGISWQIKSSADPNLKYGMKIESKTKDPRYSSLESKLSPLVRSKTAGDIPAIVSNMESLHVRPKKRPTDANRSKIEVKAWEFMKEKGFAF